MAENTASRCRLLRVGIKNQLFLFFRLVMRFPAGYRGNRCSFSLKKTKKNKKRLSLSGKNKFSHESIIWNSCLLIQPEHSEFSCLCSSRSLSAKFGKIQKIKNKKSPHNCILYPNVGDRIDFFWGGGAAGSHSLRNPFPVSATFLVH